MITVQVKRPARLPVEKSILVHAAETTLSLAGIETEAQVSLVLGNEALLKRLNGQYRGIDAATDVLSFPAGEIDPDSLGVYLGDVVISLPRAKAQAEAEGHSLSDELQLLVAHGTLHLLGYDHHSFDDKKRMQELQDRIVQALGLQVKITL